MNEKQRTLLGDTGAATIGAAVRQCLDEVHRTSQGADADGVTIAGIGTTAAHALQGRLLLDALADVGVDLASTMPFDDPQSLFAAEWTLALILSPWKLAVAEQLSVQTVSAELTGVVDTVVRDGPEPVGVNTNSWASQAAMETLMGGREPRSILVLGSGGSSNSVALACRRAWPDTRLIGSARNQDAGQRWAQKFSAEWAAPEDLSAHLGSDSPTLMVNTTTWGETDTSEESPFVFEFDALTSPGNQFFDLNNRVSALQSVALQAGMNVMSGTFMQRATNACRAALAKARMQ